MIIVDWTAVSDDRLESPAGVLVRDAADGKWWFVPAGYDALKLGPWDDPETAKFIAGRIGGHDTGPG